MSRPNLIKNHGLEEKVLRLRAAGLGTRAIAKRLRIEEGIELSHMSVNSFIQEADRMLPQAREAYWVELAEQYGELIMEYLACIQITQQLQKEAIFAGEIDAIVKLTSAINDSIHTAKQLMEQAARATPTFS